MQSRYVGLDYHIALNLPSCLILGRNRTKNCGVSEPYDLPVPRSTISLRSYWNYLNTIIQLDDAAGLAVSEKMRAQITELERCEINVSEGIDIAQTADGALGEVGEMLLSIGICPESVHSAADFN